MVWLHGGAFAYGSGNREVTSGENLARRGDVVVVSVNHRLNILGYLDLAERGGSRFAHSGNAGSLDLVAAFALGPGQHRPVSAATPATSRSSANPAAAERVSVLLGDAGR